LPYVSVLSFGLPRKEFGVKRVVSCLRSSYSIENEVPAPQGRDFQSISGHSSFIEEELRSATLTVAVLVLFVLGLAALLRLILAGLAALLALARLALLTGLTALLPLSGLASLLIFLLHVVCHKDSS
jgi:hypothetical protein